MSFKLFTFTLSSIHLFLFGILAFGGISNASEVRKEFYQTMTHCDQNGQCPENKWPDCQLTLTYKNEELVKVSVWGKGENPAGMKGYYQISNDESSYGGNSGLTVKSNKVTVRGDSIFARILVTAFRFDALRRTEEIRVRGFQKDSVESIDAFSRTRIFLLTDGRVTVSCEKLKRVYPKD